MGSGSLGPNLSDLIALPTAASGWKVTQTREDNSSIAVTATRTLAAGETLRNDIGIKASGVGAPGLRVQNTVTVRTIAPGQLEYRETLHWNGPRPKDLDASDPDVLNSLKSALPTALASDTAAAKKVVTSLQAEIWHVMFGPGEPLLPIIAFHPDLAEYRLRQQLHGAIRRALANAYGDRLSPADLDTATERLTSEAASSTTQKTQQKTKAGPAGASADSDSTPPIALLMRVKMPGKVTSTNGQIDAESGEVYWALYSDAPAVEDITLTATCDTSRKPR